MSAPTAGRLEGVDLHENSLVSQNPNNMKRRTWCGKEVSNEVTACPIDGRTATELEASAPQSASAGEQPSPPPTSQAVFSTASWSYTKTSIVLGLLGSVVAMFVRVKNAAPAWLGTSSLAFFTCLFFLQALCWLFFFHAQSRKKSSVGNVARAAMVGEAMVVGAALVLQLQLIPLPAINELISYTAFVPPFLNAWFFLAVAKEDVSLRAPAYAALVGASIEMICAIVVFLPGVSPRLEGGLPRLLGLSLNMLAATCYVIFFSTLAVREGLPSITLYGTWAAVGGLLIPLGPASVGELGFGRSLRRDRVVPLILVGIVLGIGLARTRFVRKAK